MSQIPLPLRLQDHAVFDTFWASGNEAVVAFAESLVDSPGASGCWLWGARSTGKSHLLQAICARSGVDAQFLPLRELKEAGAGTLEGMASRAIVCLDDVDEVAGDAEWEEALFRLLIDAAEQGTVVVAAALASARETGFRRDDVGSRFTQLPSFQLSPLSDEGLGAALELRASHRGLELPKETARYLLNRQRRDMASLYDLLDRLDGEAMVAKRRLTVPFVKSVLGD